MRRSQRLIAAAVLIALSGALAGCAGGMSSFDPSDLLDWLDTKKKLPGERKPVFPEGGPGLEQGVPKNLYKGSAQEQIDQQNAAAAAAAAERRFHALISNPHFIDGRQRAFSGKVVSGLPQENALIQISALGSLMPFTIAIIGRPNVGKSTLFNRLVGQKLALVDDEPGVTRDRREGEGRLGDLEFTVIDTAGLDEGAKGSLTARMQEQTEAAIGLADALMFVIDARAGLTPNDRAFADFARRANKPVVLVANKSEGKQGDAGAMEAYALGLGEPIQISAEHGEGLSELYEPLRALMPEPVDEPEEFDDDEVIELEEDLSKRPIRVAIVGRPNAGKSTLINRLLGEERLLTSAEAGTTRDSISVEINWQGP